MKLIPTIGIEVHVQLNTMSKMFCSCRLSGQDDSKPNQYICPICIGLPGTLPTLNQKAVELALQIGHFLDAEIQEQSSFDRKNYFYPDLPKGYQITQFYQPIIRNGRLTIWLDDDNSSSIKITEAHLEEDAAKAIHPEGQPYSQIDFNRAGAPLLEIVSAPDMATPEEAKRYLTELYLLVTSIGACQGDMQKGHFKFDLNISVAEEGSTTLGTRTELKNLNSFRFAKKALEYEIDRQIYLLSSGKIVIQETRGYNEAEGKTFSQRNKEDSDGYRYFPEPDIPPLDLKTSLIDATRPDTTSSIQLRGLLQSAGLSLRVQDTILLDPKSRLLFMQTLAIFDNDPAKIKPISNWLIGEYQTIESPNLSASHLRQLIELIEASVISNNLAKEIFPDICQGRSPQDIIKERGLTQINDQSIIDSILRQVIGNNPEAVTQYQSGEQKILGFLIGQAMKETKGQANPQLIRKTLVDLLDNMLQ
ncbi:Asp-tRNA(Asn)/Glu-tRNA(Gln) amidotransferase subunit GatB [Candidatus Saccharibacteria bacterium]|nr:Asp-tRNA(Asn)/Glu-tRNA(Gln) amidotransferase subunit GatB [Candidatus Saccharibacteria bacterium]MCB9834937.1 Asp-tRNA(Asn)/Glu-tRNA(Gln) amidotransferase subunit GatB [Candidatus Nomurabacteria bacterium]